MDQKQVITRDMIAGDLRKAGISRGDVLAVHSSLKSIGYVEGGAESVIAALEDVLTPDGTLLMPTHSYSLPMWEKPPYDKTGSPSLVGKITDVFWRMPGVSRSDHPTHSMAAWGRLATELSSDTLNRPPVGIGSPWHRFYQAGGKILMLGTNQGANTTMHLCEVMADVPYLDVGFTPGLDYEVAHRIDETGEVVEFILKQVPGCSEGFPETEPLLREKGILKDVAIGCSKSQLLSAPAMVDEIVSLLGKHPDFLLCRRPDCGICSRRRKAVRENRG